MKKRRMRFSSTFDILLLKAVTAVDAHLAPHGESQKRFDEALGLFTASLPAAALQGMCQPSWKTLNDRFKKIVADHRIAVKRNGAASGIIEVRGERELLLDDIVLAVDEWEEGRRAERDERTELDRRLREAGETIRSNALGRACLGSVDGEKEGSGEESLRKRQRKRPTAAVDSDDEGRSAITEHISEQREYDKNACAWKRKSWSTARLEI